jgi:hypothetical protein
MLFGHHTVDELIDLVAGKSDDVAMLAQLRASHPQITSIDPAWDTDYAKMKSRWDSAKKAADALIQSSKYNITTPNSLIPAEDAYQGVLHALSPVPNTVTPGSFADLSARLGKTGARPPVGWQVTQPKTDPLRDANAAVHTIQDVAKAPFEGAADMIRDAAEGGVKIAGKIIKAPADGAAKALGIPIWAVVLLGLGGGALIFYLLYRGVRAAAPVALRVAEVATPQGRAITAIRAVNAGLGNSPFQQRVRELQAAE